MRKWITEGETEQGREEKQIGRDALHNSLPWGFLARRYEYNCQRWQCPCGAIWVKLLLSLNFLNYLAFFMRYGKFGVYRKCHGMRVHTRAVFYGHSRTCMVITVIAVMTQKTTRTFDSSSSFSPAFCSLLEFKFIKYLAMGIFHPHPKNTVPHWSSHAARISSILRWPEFDFVGLQYVLAWQGQIWEPK